MTVASIEVERTGDGDPLTFSVHVEEGGGATTHEVTAARSDLGRLGASSEQPEAFVTRCFEFLLEREPASSIMSEFSLDVITRYFPEYPQELPRRL